jgi:hypothetical protein
MESAHARITSHYASTARSGAYDGQFYDGPHKFHVEMQHAAFTWLTGNL